MQPSLAARMTSTLDRISEGRLLINVVAGGDPYELAIGRSLKSARICGRVSAWSEAGQEQLLSVIRRLLPTG